MLRAMRAYRSSLRLAALALLSGVMLFATRALAQDDSDPVPESEHPGTDSPESVSSAARNTAGRKRAQAFLIPLDEKARSATARVAQALERALAAARQYEVVDLAKALASDAEPAQEQKASEGRKLIAEGNQAFAARAYPDAVVKYKAAIKGLSSGLAALEPHEMADAFLRLAAAQQLSGDPKEVKAARDAYVTVALLDPQGKVLAASVDPVAEQPLLIARNDIEQIPIGKLELETRPVGARVIIDGQAQGATPTVVELTGGKHMLRLERTGFYPTSELIDVASRRDTRYSVTLSATPGASTLNQLIAGAADEASRGHPGEKTLALANRFHLDRALIGSVSSHGIKVSLLLALADPYSGQLLGREELLLVADGTDSDQLEFDTQEAARKLFALDDGSHPAAPLPASPAPAYSSTAASQSYPPPEPAPIEPAPAPAPAASSDGSRHMVMPGAATPAPPPPPPEAAPTADDPGLVGKDRRPVAPVSQAPAPTPIDEAPAPVSPAANASASNQAADAPAPESPAGQPKPDPKKKKKDKQKDLHNKSGTEGWDSN